MHIAAQQQRHTVIYTVCRFFCIVLFTLGHFAVYAHSDLHHQITTLSQEIKADPKQAKLYLKRGELHRQHESWQEALSDYNIALTIDKKLAGAYLGRANAWMALVEPAKAKGEINIFLAIQPTHIDAHLLRARAQTQLGEHAAAAETYAWVISNAERPQPEYFLDRANSLSAAGKLLDAISSLDGAMNKLGPLISLAVPAIAMERQAERWDAALERVNKIMSSSARKESWYVLRAEIQRDAKRPEAVVEEAKKAEAAIAALPPNLRNNKATREIINKINVLMNIN